MGGTSHGTVTLNGDGSFTYTPSNGYVGSDAFTYKVNDGQADSNVASVRRFEFVGDDRVVLRPAENENVLTWERVK